MNGTRISCTIWHVCFRYLNPEKGESSARYLGGETFVSTADPTGADLVDVTRSVMLPNAQADAEFTVTHSKWVTNLRGLACLDRTSEA